MKSFKNLSFVLSSLLLCGALSAAPTPGQTATPTPLQQATAHIIAHHVAPQEQLESGFLPFAKACALEIGVPELLRSNSYTRFALYPYLWWYRGYRTALERLAVDGITYLIGGNSSQRSFVAKAAIEYGLSNFVVKPIADGIFGPSQEKSTTFDLYLQQATSSLESTTTGTV